jgi:hypothetical protein
LVLAPNKTAEMETLSKSEFGDPQSSVSHSYKMHEESAWLKCDVSESYITDVSRHLMNINSDSNEDEARVGRNFILVYKFP